MRNKQAKERKRKTQADKIIAKARSLRTSYLKYGIPNAPDVAELRAVLMVGVTCPYCGALVETQKVSLDHIQPRSLGGADTMENTWLTCIGCNRMKGNLSDADFKLLMAWLADKPSLYKNLRVRLQAAGWAYWKGK